MPENNKESSPPRRSLLKSLRRLLSVTWYLLLIGSAAALYFQDSFFPWANEFWTNQTKPTETDLISLEDSQVQHESLAQILNLQGQAYLKKNQENPFKLSEKDFVFDGDSIFTSSHSLLLLSFKSGEKVELKAETEALLERFTIGSSQKVRLIVFKGGMKVVDAGSSEVELWQNGHLYDPQIDALTLEPQANIVPAAIVPPLSDKKDEISQTMLRQTFWFKKCYANYLKENPSSTGTVQVSFGVLPNGKVEDAKVYQSSFHDESLKSCILSTVNRTRFPAHDGPTKQVVFPIEFKE